MLRAMRRTRTGRRPNRRARQHADPVGIRARGRSRERRDRRPTRRVPPPGGRPAAGWVSPGGGGGGGARGLESNPSRGGGGGGRVIQTRPPLGGRESPKPGGPLFRPRGGPPPQHPP